MTEASLLPSLSDAHLRREVYDYFLASPERLVISPTGANARERPLAS